MDSDAERQQLPLFNSYHFVTDQDPSQPSQIRRHVARRRWIHRKAPGILRGQRTTPRLLEQASTARKPTTSTPDLGYASVPLGSSSSNEVFIDVRLSLKEGTRRWTISKIPKSSGYPDPYQSLGHEDLDPFNGVRLSRDDQQLLHHCKSRWHISSEKLN